MAGAEAQRAGQLGVPRCGGLTGTGIDQVEGDPPEMPLRHVERGETFADVVQPSEEPETGVIERL